MNKLNIATIDNKSDACISLTHLYKQGSYIQSLKICDTKSSLMNNILENKIDFIVIDLDVEKIDGIRLLKEIREMNEEINILVVANSFEQKDIKIIYELANGSFLKGKDSASLLGVILLVSSGYQMHLDVLYKKKLAKHELLKDVVTKRELEVLELVANGYSNKQIASTLFITNGSVRNHISSILFKLNLTNRTKLAMWYINNIKD